MKPLIPFALAFSLCTFAFPLPPTALAESATPAELADPTIDTVRPRIDFFASASVPMGMVALHPDTHHSSGQLWNSGYRWNDKRILFFTHCPGTDPLTDLEPGTPEGARLEDLCALSSLCATVVFKCRLAVGLRFSGSWVVFQSATKDVSTQRGK